MSQVLVRRVSVMIVVIVIALVALPVADARPLAGPHSSVSNATSWMSALSTWASSFFLGTSAKTTTPVMRLKAADSSANATDGRMRTMTGSCVDPNGHPIPCNPV